MTVTTLEIPAATLTLTGSAPAARSLIRPLAGAVVLTGNAPGAVEIQPGALVLTGAAGPVLQKRVPIPLATLTLEGTPPTATLAVAPATAAALTLTGGAPATVRRVAIAPGGLGLEPHWPQLPETYYLALALIWDDADPYTASFGTILEIHIASSREGFDLYEPTSGRAIWIVVVGGSLYEAASEILATIHAVAYMIPVDVDVHPSGWVPFLKFENGAEIDVSIIDADGVDEATITGFEAVLWDFYIDNVFQETIDGSLVSEVVFTTATPGLYHLALRTAQYTEFSAYVDAVEP